MLPVGKANPNRWKRELISKKHFFVVDEEAWKRNLEAKFGTCVRY